MVDWARPNLRGEELNLAILHYHLNRGGVTGVIYNQIKSMRQGGLPINKILIVHGPGQSGWDSSPEMESSALSSLPPIETVEVAELGYDSSDQLDRSLGKRIISTLAGAGLDHNNSVVQIHNHNLGKNNSLLLAIRELADQNFRLLLQIHDFAEDLRPANFRHMTECFARHKLPLNEYLYPDRVNIHYAFLNQRDLDFFTRSSIARERIHFLPNPVVSDPADHPTSADSVKSQLGMNPREQLVVYPVRAIRRKNITEALLFAACNPEVRLAVTLPAESKNEIPSYTRNRRLAEELQLPVLFEAGRRGVKYADLIHSADFIFTSSVAEGFGMVFLECWLHGKQLIGRNLAEITIDFSNAGMDFSGLYQRLAVPTEWLDLRSEIRQQQTLLHQVLDQFVSGDESFKRGELMDQLAHGLERDFVDFARLMPLTQGEIVKQICSNNELRESLLQLNPLLGLPVPTADLVESNATVVRSVFSTGPFAERFGQILSQMDNPSQPGSNVKPGFPSNGGILQCFLHPGQFIPVRVAED